MVKKYGAVFIAALFVTIFLIPIGAEAPAGGGQVCPNFFWQTPLPQGSTLSGIGAADGSTAWAVGDNFTVIKTTDGGSTWKPQDLGFFSMKPQELAQNLYAVSVVNRDIAWICSGTTGQPGSVSHIFRTVDGGATWDRILCPVPGLTLKDISAVSSRVAWVAARERLVLRTTDGGRNWDLQQMGPSQVNWESISALDENNVWVAGSSGEKYAAVTHDGGQSWVHRRLGEVAAGGLDIQAMSRNIAYVAVRNKFMTIDDSGGGWRTTKEALGDNSVDLSRLSFTGTRSGWMLGSSLRSGEGFVTRTTDSGRTWSFIKYPVTGTATLLDIQAAGSASLWGAGQAGMLLKTDDSGKNWSRSDSNLLGFPSGAYAIDSPNEKTAFVAGEAGGVWRTGNGGESWERLQSGVDKSLLALDALDSRVVWAVGDEGTIIKTADGGWTWSKQETGVPETLLHVSAVSPDVAWASGDNSRLLRTEDGGATWRTLDVGLRPQELCIRALDGDTAWCGAGPGDYLTPDGTMLKTGDAGATWQVQVLPNPLPERYTFNRTMEISVVNPQVVYALAEVVTDRHVDAFGKVFKTTDGGNTWRWVHDEVLDRAYVTLDGMAVAGEDAVSVSGRRGSFYKSTDGGESWTHEIVNTGGNLRGVAAVGAGAEWLVDESGGVLRSTTPFVYSVSPDTALNTGPVSIAELAGNGFQEGMIVKLVKSGTELVAGDVNVLSPYQATCTFDLEGAEEGEYDVLAFNTNGRSGGLPHGFHVIDSRTWYLPEGSTAVTPHGSFETWVLIENPNNSSTAVDVEYMTPGGAVKGPSIEAPAKSRVTVNVSETVPNEWSVSTKIDADMSVVAERAMYWDTGATFRQAAASSIGLTHSSRKWYLAEGSTGSDENGSFETWVLLQNPGSEAAGVNLIYETPAGKVAGPRVELAPGTRKSVNVADTVPGEWSVSTTVESDIPIVAERAMYWSGETFRQAATGSIGTARPAEGWFLAEGSTGMHDYGAFETWVLVQNPADQVTTAKLLFQTPAGEKEGPVLVLEPHTRQSVRVSDTVPNEFSVSTWVDADNPVVAERAMYWNTPDVYRQAAHDSIGVKAPWDEWFIPEGSTAGDSRGSFETWILLQNPGTESANAQLTYMTPDGAVAGPTVTLEPGTRQTVNVDESVPEAWSVSTMVVSDLPVMAERATYWDGPVIRRQAATGSIGFGQ